MSKAIIKTDKGDLTVSFYDKDAPGTVANFLKVYTPQLQGASHGSHLLEACHGVICPPFQVKGTWRER